MRMHTVEASMNCPKCNGEMDEGIQPDATYGRVLRAAWIKGKELPGLTASFLSLFSLKFRYDKEGYYVTVYRCRSCGFLESYAVEPIE
jgi:hypothetical protein